MYELAYESLGSQSVEKFILQCLLCAWTSGWVEVHHSKCQINPFLAHTGFSDSPVFLYPEGFLLPAGHYLFRIIAPPHQRMHHLYLIIDVFKQRFYLQ